MGRLEDQSEESPDDLISYQLTQSILSSKFEYSLS